MIYWKYFLKDKASSGTLFEAEKEIRRWAKHRIVELKKEQKRLESNRGMLPPNTPIEAIDLTVYGIGQQILLLKELAGE